jgi:hypothetical protein
VTSGARELARDEFRGRSAEAATSSLPMAQVLTAGKPGTAPAADLLARRRRHALHGALRYAADALHQDGLDAGFQWSGATSPSSSRARARRRRATRRRPVRVTLTFRLTKERRFVAVTDPLPAGFEAVESWFATTARDLAAAQTAR